MSARPESNGCGSAAHFSRRNLLQAAGGLAGLTWLTPLAERLGRAEEKAHGGPARSVIVLWLQGGPSQLETFDPHPAKYEKDKLVFGSETPGMQTAAKGVEICETYPRLAEHMQDVALIRSVVSKEGDHERGTYNLKTGFRPDPTLNYPSIGSVLCHETTDAIEIPRHVSIFPNQWAPRGGWLGDQYDAFRIYDPARPVPDVLPAVAKDRYEQRMGDLLNVVETQFAKRRLKDLDQKRTLHRPTLEAAAKMMNSDQLKAFDVSQAPKATLDEFGDSAFGRGCLAALQLIEVGVRCVEVNLDGWDSHANNKGVTDARAKTLDPAFASLLKHLKERDRLKDTIVLCMGEFGRTPIVNALSGRDHWPHGFTVALAGGGIRGGQAIGATNPEPKQEAKAEAVNVVGPQPVENIHATIFRALGVNFERDHLTPIGRPMSYSKGKVIDELLS